MRLSSTTRTPCRSASPGQPGPLTRNRSAFALVIGLVEPPAGIEPATPSLPSMVGPFGVQRGTSLRSTEPQVTGPVDDREMGCCEAVCGAAAGKSLARIPVGCPVVTGLMDAHVRGSGNGSKPVELLERVIGPEFGFEPTIFRLRVGCFASAWMAPRAPAFFRYVRLVR
jgi:hypothetical protein